MKLRCQALDMDGKRCKNIAKHIERYHGDYEIYSGMDDNSVTWVEACLCDKHQKTHKESENYAGKVDIKRFVLVSNPEGRTSKQRGKK